MITAEKKAFAKLGYSHLDTAQIVTILNKLLASYAVYQQKLKNFHWNIIGQDFFELHELFEKMYSRAGGCIFGNQNCSALSKFIRTDLLLTQAYRLIIVQSSSKEIYPFSNSGS